MARTLCPVWSNNWNLTSLAASYPIPMWQSYITRPFARGWRLNGRNNGVEVQMVFMR